MTGRDSHGRFQPGHSGNPGGRPSRNSDLREKWLDALVSADALAELGLPDALLSQLSAGCTYREVIAARTVFEAAMGGQGLTEANARLWPKVEKREQSFQGEMPVLEPPVIVQTDEELVETARIILELLGQDE